MGGVALPGGGFLDVQVFWVDWEGPMGRVVRHGGVQFSPNLNYGDLIFKRKSFTG